jgi:hypothetical protein
VACAHVQPATVKAHAPAARQVSNIRLPAVAPRGHRRDEVAQTVCTPGPVTVCDIARSAAKAAFGRRLITNVHRGLIVEAIVDSALPAAWSWCSQDYAPWDFQHIGGARLEVRQAAARQSWDQVPKRRRLPSFDIAKRTGAYGTNGWIADRRRWADLYLLAYHSIVSDEADHRDGRQWQFYAIAERALPDQASIGMAHVRRLASPCGYGDLDEVLTSLASTLGSSPK